MMKILIAGGTGFVGRHLTHRYLSQDHNVTVLGRDAGKIQQTFGDTVTALSWRELTKVDNDALRPFDLVINLTGASLAHWPWTKRYKAIIYNSRINATTTLANLCAELGADSPPLLNASAVGVYGLQEPKASGLAQAMDESTKLDFDRPTDFLSRVARAWEQATEPAKKAGVRVVNMRFAVILGPDGGVLPLLKLPFHLFVGGTVGNGTQPFSWLALPDLLKAIEFLARNESIQGPVNLVAPNCVTQRELAKAIGRAMHRPAWFHTPGWLMKLMLGQMAIELQLNGQHIKPSVLEKHGFSFDYPHINEALSYAINGN
jgi:uncharacterized protein (TIGR01777 family)